VEWAICEKFTEETADRDKLPGSHAEGNLLSSVVLKAISVCNLLPQWIGQPW
jgi:hypothetical protein